MNFNILYFAAELPAPLIILALSAWIGKNPPELNASVGYRTRRSMSSEQAWAFAQAVYGSISTKAFAVFSVVTVIVGVVGIAASFDEDTGIAVFIAHSAALVALQFAVFAFVERKLKLTFDENGEPKGR